MEINIKNLQNVVLLELAGRIDGEGAREIKKTILNLLKSNKTSLHLNLSRVSYINSLGLGILVTIHQAVGKANGRITFSQPNKFTQEILESTHLNQIFEIYPDDMEAYESFNIEKTISEI